VFKLPQSQIMFAAHGDLYAPYLQIAQMIRTSNPRTVGLVQGVDDWEYPLWKLTGGALGGRRFVDVVPADYKGPYKGKAAPAYDFAICTDLTPNACAILAKPGWTLTAIGTVTVATRTP
jgi:hypothetical protein